MTTPPLVEIRCRRCRKTLQTVAAAPAAHDEDGWATEGEWFVCPDHFPGSGPVAGYDPFGRQRREPQRVAHDVRKWQGRQAAQGKDPENIVLSIMAPWSMIRAEVEAARHSGKTQVHRL